MSEFVGVEDEIRIPKCHRCKHYISGLMCNAFTQIPLDIYMNRFDHTQPYPGDNGIQFEPIEDSNANRDNPGA